MSSWERAFEQVSRFEREDKMVPSEAEGLVAAILLACGHQISNKGFAHIGDGTNCFFDTEIGGKFVRLGVEVKAGKMPADVAAIGQAFELRRSGHFDRAIVIARSGFSQAALLHAATLGAGEVDLFGPIDLRNWLSKHEPTRPLDDTAHGIVRMMMKALAIKVAECPAELADVEWRDLERLLREVFEGIGYDTSVTRSGKDGGFDLELKFVLREEPVTYLVEVKHWSTTKPGMKQVNKLVEVTASRKAQSGLLLSTSGFSQPVYAGLMRLTAPVRIADGIKVVSLCQKFYRLQSGLWLEETDLEATFREETLAAGKNAVDVW